MAKRNSRVGRGRTTAGSKNGRAPRVDQLIVRHRVAVVENVVGLLQRVQPIPAQKYEKRRKAARALPRKSTARRALAAELRVRRKVHHEIEEAIAREWHLLQALQSECLTDGGIVERRCTPVAKGVWDIGPEPAQYHLRHGPTVAWRSTLLRCAGACQVAGAECIEPAIIGCVQILRELRDLVEDEGLPTLEEQKVYDQRGRLRKPARDFLKALETPAATLDEVARRLDRDEDYVRKFSVPLQDLGLIRQRTDGRWERTKEAEQLLRTQ